tara:strand:- start:1539 stop:2546 length:1008 start_codon:yes stop_codon:yes gene_type:complete
MSEDVDFQVIAPNIRVRKLHNSAQIVLILNENDAIPNFDIAEHYSITQTLFEVIVDTSDSTLPTEDILLMSLDETLLNQCDSFVEVLNNIRSEDNADRFTPMHLLQTIRQLKFWREKPQIKIDIVGINGELELLIAMIEWAGSDPVKASWVISIWAGNQTGVTFDFIGKSIVIEQKTTVRNDSRIHSFSNHLQATPPENTHSYIGSIGLKRVQAGSLAGSSLSERIESVRAILNKKYDPNEPSIQLALQRFNNLISDSEVETWEGFDDLYRVNPNLPLRLYPYSQIEGIEAIREHYVPGGWHSPPSFVLSEDDGLTIEDVLAGNTGWCFDAEEEE